MRVGLVASSGGHLSQLHAVAGALSAYDRTWVSFDTPHAQALLAAETVTWAHHPTNRNVGNFARNLVLAAEWLRTERPELVVSTGAGVAVPFLWTAAAAGVKTVFVEVFDRTDAPSLTGRLVAPFVDLVVLQREAQRRLYPRGVLLGAVR